MIIVKRPYGFTLIEVMTAVAVVGIMLALGISSLRQLISVGRANGSAKTVARAGLNARTISVTQACPTILQVNGSAYPGAPANGNPSFAYLYRKQDCAATAFDFTPGVDLPVQSIELPSTKVATNLGSADNVATLLVYNATGTLSVWQGSGGAAADIGAGSLTLTFTTKDGAGTRRVLFPSAGGPKVQ